MDNKIEELEQPYNANERYLYAVCTRLDALIHMMSSFMEVYANQNKMTTTSNVVVEEKVEEVTPKKRTNKAK